MAKKNTRHKPATALARACVLLSELLAHSALVLGSSSVPSKAQGPDYGAKLPNLAKRIRSVLLCVLLRTRQLQHHGVDAVGKMGDPDLTKLIASLEGLSKKIQEAAEKEPGQVETELESATTTAEQVIFNALPVEERGVWLDELGILTQRDERLKASSSDDAVRPVEISKVSDSSVPDVSSNVACRCALLRQERTDTSAHDFVTGVTCIHGCGYRFCSATCRKKQIRPHSSKCPAIAKKKVLRAMGLTGDGEFF